MAKAPTEIRSLARQHTTKAIQKLQGLMDNGQNEQVQLSAAIALLDRGWGKPESYATVKHVNTRAEELSDDELAAIAAGSSEASDTPPLDPSQLN
jgi:hypothetical protein